MRVLHVIAPVRFGGGEALLVSLLGARRPGLEEAVAPIYAATAFEAGLSAIGIAWSRLSERSLGDGVPRAALLADTWRWPAMLARLHRMVARLRIDLLHLHGFPAIMLWRLLAALRRVPAIYTHHFHRGPAGRLETALLGRAYRACAARTGVSDLVSRSMAAAFPAAGGFVTVRNAVDDAFFAATPDPAWRTTHAGRAVFVHPARFSPFKNHALVIEALAALPPAQRARLAVWFAGDGALRAEVEAEAGRRGLADCTRFMGAVPHADMPGLLAAADHGLFPSELEGFGLGAAECLAAGRPVLALDNELMREVVGEGGILVPRGQLAAGLVRMLDEGAALAPAARRAAARFRVASVRDAYVGLYRQVLAGP
jgi:glycosyltransferase involved in cell wall biosynthesis